MWCAGRQWVCDRQQTVLLSASGNGCRLVALGFARLRLTASPYCTTHTNSSLSLSPSALWWSLWSCWQRLLRPDLLVRPEDVPFVPAQLLHAVMDV